MFELRVLNGYHRGATLPLNEGAYIVGSAEQADVVLADPGVLARHASVHWSGSAWMLQALDGGIRNALDNQPRDSLSLAPGDAARVGQIWLAVARQGSAWQEPPPEPQDVPAPPAAAPGQPAHAKVDRPLHYLDDSVTGAPAPAAPAMPAPRKRPRRRILLVPLTLVAMGSAAYAITNRQPAPPAAKVQQEAASPAPARALSQEQLRQALRKRLAEVDLLNRFDLQLSDSRWTMQAVLDEDEADRFRRMLAGFVAQHGITFPVEAKVGNAELMLPFRIQQVISGSNASIVTDDGRRLYVGDEYRGMRLAAIGANQLTFTGKRKLEVRW